MSILAIIIILIFAIILWVVLTYNRLVSLRNRAKEAWSDINVQLKRRYDLIPNLVETVKGYASHEKEIFEKVSEARARAMGATGMKERAEAENQLSQTLKSLFAVVEAYPELKANENFLQLQKDLVDTEDKIQYARRFYNTNVRDLNTLIESFPANLIAKNFGFEKMELFEIAEAEKETPKVKF
jgi:LemA protein